MKYLSPLINSNFIVFGVNFVEFFALGVLVVEVVELLKL